MKKLITILLLFSSLIFGQPGTDLDLGDIAFTGYRSDGDDAFSFVLLKDILSGTEITFTDQGWLSVGGFFPDEPENTIVWTSNSQMFYGTQILIQDNGTGTGELITSIGTVSGAIGLSDKGDQLFAYQGSVPTVGDEGNFIAAIQMNGKWDEDAIDKETSAMPAIFQPNGTYCLFIDPEVDNAVFKCLKSADANTLRAAVNNQSNWEVSGSYKDPYPFSIPNCTEPLPVELVMFEASINKENVNLNWQTATEVNNFGFNVERKPETGEWNKVGFVEGHGNSNSPKYYCYTDKLLKKSGKYLYRLKQIDIDGTFEYSDAIEIILIAPDKFQLSQNYPNPFNPTTTISFSIPEDANVELQIYNLLGEEKAKLTNKLYSAGTYSLNLNASSLTSGVYIYSLKVNTVNGENVIQNKKMILAK